VTAVPFSTRTTWAVSPHDCKIDRYNAKVVRCININGNKLSYAFDGYVIQRGLRKCQDEAVEHIYDAEVRSYFRLDRRMNQRHCRQSASHKFQMRFDKYQMPAQWIERRKWRGIVPLLWIIWLN
jgi:hypothetical protein